ncbi:MAG: tetratricopeptide repeat protein [Acidobacteria bacterium]|nr:tetratricopeptide repeat protein [Acidobacteriota bacterium]
MARLTRQELKKDEFAERLAVLQEWFLQNQKSIGKTAVIAVVAVAVLIGGYVLVRNRQNRAAAAFTNALSTFHALVAETPPAGYTGPHFKTNAEKYQQALKEFSDVASRYSWMPQGKFARYYAALCERELGKTQEAERGLKDLASGGKPELASLAKMALAGLYEQSGRNDEAEKTYRELAAKPTSTVPKATAELALADLLRRTKPDQAKQLYEQIQKDYAGMTAADEASKILEAQAQ